jgi:uncharacterized protein YciI
VTAYPVRYVILHRPGPNWEAGRPPFEQPGVMDHIAYTRVLSAAGTVLLGGPFVAGGDGGMMITREGLSPEEAEAIGRDDPGVRNGLIAFEIRTLLVTLPLGGWQAEDEGTA